MEPNSNSDKSKSHHIFAFPFKWDIKTGGKSIEQLDFSERTSLEKFDNLLTKSGSVWKEDFFEINSPLDYNEYIYFYDFAREALFADSKNSKTLRQYKYIIESNTIPLYRIKTVDTKEKCVTYELEIEKILLTVYFTGVGILSFHMANHRYTELNDILRINEFGRHIYPQFLNKHDEFPELTRCTKEAFLADSLEIVFDKKKKFESDFKCFDTIDSAKKNKNTLSNTIMGVLGNSFHTDELKKEKEGIRISPILDDRLFVFCWIADKAFCKELANYKKKKEEYNYTYDDDWYKLVFIDKSSPSCNSIPMKKKLLTEHTYDRWIGTEWSSLFGITRYSFILLNDSEKTFFKDHFKTMYFRMVLLSLVQRASILRFSSEATYIANMEESENTSDKLRKLQKKYLQFINKIYFREITAIEQGIELYEKIIKAMNIERDVKALDQEIEELHNYVSLQEENRRNDLLQKITIIGSLFLIPAFISGFFGMNIFSNVLDVGAPSRLITIVMVMLIACFISWLLFTRHDRMKKPLLIGLVFFEILIIFLLLSGCFFSLLGV